MEIIHEQFVNLYNADNKIFNKLFDGTNTIQKLANKIDKNSKNYLSYGYIDKKAGDNSGEYKMKGDTFEIFIECFGKILGAANNIGIYGYKPLPSVEDNGVDFTGIGLDGGPLTGQIKFRSDASQELLQEDLKQFGFQSIVNYGVNKDTKINMVLITCAKGMHFKTEHDVFLDRIRTIGIDQLGHHINGNYCFWKSLSDMIYDTVKLRYTAEILNKFTPINL